MADQPQHNSSLGERLQAMFDKCDDNIVLIDPFYIHWQAKGIGAGELRFYNDDNGQIRCMNECMGKEFIKRMLCNMVDQCVLDDVRP